MRTANKSIRILVAEDHDVSRFILSKCMNRPDWIVEFVRSGREAVNHAAQNKYDLVMLDIELPDFNGYQVAQLIRSTPDKQISNIPIIAMTGHSSNADIAKAMRAGMNGHLNKPFNGDQLNNCIQTIMNNVTASENRSPVEPDLKFLREVASGDTDFMCTFIGLFLKEIPENLDKLLDAINQNDWESTRSLSHKMKSSLLYAGLKEQHALAARIERAAAGRERFDGIRNDFNELKNGCTSSYEGLRASLLLLQNQTNHESRKGIPD
jgi:CheY-like chemotaxis protein